MKSLQLCYDCFMKHHLKFMKAWEHNQDKDVEWWEQWWGKDIDQQVKAITTHCRDLTPHNEDPRWANRP